MRKTMKTVPKMAGKMPPSVLDSRGSALTNCIPCGSGFVTVAGSSGLKAGATSDPLTVTSQLGYTGTEARAEMMKNSQFVDPMSAQFGGEQIVKDFASSNTEQALAVRLTGKFKTAFPEGKPKATEEKKDEKKPEPPVPEEPALKESKEESAVVLIGDSDFVQDQIAVQEMPNIFGGGQRTVMPANGNLAFVQGVIEQLAGDNNLIAVRSRASRERQFTVVKEMQAKEKTKKGEEDHGKQD